MTGPCQREPLPLPARKRHPLLADAGVETPGKIVTRNPPARAPAPRRSRRLGRVRPSEDEVLAHAHREKDRLLEHDGDVATQRLDREYPGRRCHRV